MAIAVALALLAAACSDDGSDATEADPTISASELDNDTMSATLTVDGDELEVAAQPFGESPHVGRVDDELFVAVTRPTEGEAEDLAVYLCDGDDVAVWMTDQVGPEGGTVSADGFEVEVAFAEGGVIGEVTDPGGDRSSFDASETDTGGLFVAAADHENEDGDNPLVAWIVLDDGDQRGLAWWAAWTWSSQRSGGGGMEEEELQM
ncbi:MAG: hypothetical protein ACLFRV_05885 [Acidimicrobiales bacterium]